MKLLIQVVICGLLLVWSFVSLSNSDNINSVNDDSLFNYYSTDHVNSSLDELVLRVKGGPSVANKLAKQYGYINYGQIANFTDTYSFRRRFVSEKMRRKVSSLDLLAKEKEVKWIEPQYALVRVKRDFIPLDELNQMRLEKRLSNESESESQSAYKASFLASLFNKLPHFFSNNNNNERQLTKYDFNDELWKSQWYIHNDQYSLKPSLRIIEAWKLGYTGKGVVVSIMDDGLEHNHTDIFLNYDPHASLDINGKDTDPFPRYSDENAHGTRCAGEVAMVANNRKCGVGVAFNAKVGGIRLLDGRVSDVVEALAVSHNLDHIDIYSASWGPQDDGETVDGPKTLTIEALIKGVTYGRKGKGAIYVWASGNGGSKGDNCNCDGYASSIYTLSIGSATEKGTFPWYGEKCASTLAVTWSSGDSLDPRISTIDLKNSCTTDFTGTSASAPIAAGIFALVLEANNNLTWRDLQHLVVWTSEYHPLRTNDGWYRNGAGFMFNSKFGFGLLNAENLIKKALIWKRVPPLRICQVGLRMKSTIQIMADHNTRIKFRTKACQDSSASVYYVEHVQLLLTIAHPRRGNLEITLTSPSNTTSYLLTQRWKDQSQEGFVRWPFTSVHFWGENPKGSWTVNINDKSSYSKPGMVKFAKLIFYGTKTAPTLYPRRMYESDNEIPTLFDLSSYSWFNRFK